MNQDLLNTLAVDNGAPDGPSTGYYADDVPFRSGIVQQQAPLHMAVVAALNGYNPPRPTGAFRYCDLGCGDGTTLNAYAAIYPDAEFVGIDFNAGHIAQARSLAEAAGLDNVRFIQGSFAELDDGDLPVFDFIGMNGIYSWLARDLMASVHRLVDRHLAPNGLFYVEYMTMPGMIAVVPVWQLVQALVPLDGRGSHDRATRGLRLLEELSKSGMGYLDRHPTAQAATNGYVANWRDNPGRVDHFAHNALASGFRPRYVTEMCEEMAAAGLVFGGRAQLALNDPDLAVTLQQATLLRGVEDRPTRELLLDFMRNERNRRDVYVRAAAHDPDGALGFLLDEVRFLGRSPADRIARKLELPGPRTASLDGGVYDALVAAFDGRASPARAGDPDGDIRAETLATALHRLHTTGQYFLCEPGSAIDGWPEAPERLAFAVTFNAQRLSAAVEALTGASFVARAVGGTVMTLGPIEAVVLQAWVSAGRAAAIETALATLATLKGRVQIDGEAVPVARLTRAQLEPVLARLVNIRVPNLLRTGVLVAG